MGEDKIWCERIFNSVTISSGNSTTSLPINIATYKAKGNFSLQLNNEGGGGTLNPTYQISNDEGDPPNDNKGNYQTPVNASDIFPTPLTSDGGANSDGIDIQAFSAEIAKSLKIKVENSAGADVTCSGYLCIQ